MLERAFDEEKAMQSNSLDNQVDVDTEIIEDASSESAAPARPGPSVTQL
jgi:hypothetical protein